MTVGHSNFLPLKIQPSEHMTWSQYFFFTAKFSAKRGDDISSQQIFTAENSAKRGDDMVPIFLFTAKFSAKRGDDMVIVL